MCRKYFYILFLFSFNLLKSQIPEIDMSFHDDLMKMKSEKYRLIQLSEKHKTANQNNYDATYYSLNLTPDPSTAVLNGIVEVVGEVIAANLDHVELNFWDGMTITDIYISGVPGNQLNYSKANDILDIQLDREYVQGEQFRVMISYYGRTGDSDYYSFNFDTYNGEPMIWSMSSVSRARGWWPCKDVVSDKPDSMDIRVTVPNDLIVVSNGVLRETQTAGNQTTYWYHEKYPIATYLVSVCAHPYEVHYDDYVYNNGSDTMRVEFYNFQGNYSPYSRINLLVNDMLACFSELFGEYPFADEKYAQVDFLWGGGMEHQTCTSYGSWSEGLFAHEIAHQWWGDMITCDSFHHIWLNEGFASYSEALWFEYAYPPFSASEYQTMYQMYLGPGTVYVEDPETEDIFDSGLSYVKGSWILHMLRHVVGDEDFINILKTYYASAHQYGNATTEEFQAICEQVSGMDLGTFFHQWIYEENYPVYSYSWDWEQNGLNYDITLEIRQEQTNTIFQMPIDIAVTTSTGETTFVVQDTLAVQTFQFSVPSQPVTLELDKNNWILKRIDEEFIDPTFDQGILLVNGVSFDTYGDAIWNCYEERAFWGDRSIEFWDCFYPTVSGYPSTLPEPLGHGMVPGDVLGQYETVIWIGNDYGGDLGSWQQTSILSYLEAGGNVLLLTRKGQTYLDSNQRDYLGITWVEDPLSMIANCIAVYPGLTDMSFTGTQSYNAVFNTQLNKNESTLLFQETASFGTPRGLGVWRKPQNGGTFKSNGGQFVFISGRPYRYNTNDLQRNIEYILDNFFSDSTVDNLFSRTGSLEPNCPNPFPGSTTINFHLNKSVNISIQIYDLLGRKVRTWIHKQSFSVGDHSREWDGKDDHGKDVSSGVYFCQINGHNFQNSRKMVLLK